LSKGITSLFAVSLLADGDWAARKVAKAANASRHRRGEALGVSDIRTPVTEVIAPISALL
jgi:hypothetical protein